MHSIFNVCSDFMMAFACVVTIATIPIFCWLFWQLKPTHDGAADAAAAAPSTVVSWIIVRWTVFQKKEVFI